MGVFNIQQVDSPTKDNFYITEPKSKKEIEDEIVKAKAKAALAWIEEMNEVSEKEWKYLLIPMTGLTLL